MECEKGLLYAPKVLIVGDLNSNILSPMLPECKLLDNFMKAFDLCKMFNGPTRITESTSSHLDFTLDNLNQHFISVADKVVQGIIPTLVSPLSFVSETVSAFQFTTVSEALVILIISSLDTKKACGADNIPTRFIKVYPVSIERLVTRLINHNITSGIFPELWKYAVVTPIQKSKDNTNYRPISVLPVLSKVLERVVHDQLVSHLLKFNLLCDRQSGFRPQHSTQDVLVYVTDCWRNAIDESKFTAAAFWDVSKGFDCVNHDILLSKLACYGVMDNSLGWFASYLSGHRQRVNLQGSFSDWGMIRAGVPQGSILGPLLFRIYMNDLPSVARGCQLNMYADDMELHCSSGDLFSAQCGLQCDLDSVKFWLRTNQLSLNVGKSHVMLIGSRQKLRNSDLCVVVNDRQLSRVPSVKYLWLYVDENLTWQKHAQYVYQRVQSRLHLSLSFVSLT